MRYVILGNGYAALAALKSIRSVDSSSSIVIVSAEKELSYAPRAIHNYITGEKPRAFLYLKTADFYHDQRVETHFGDKAISIDPRNRKVNLESGKALEYDHLLIATGSNVSIPPIPGIRKKNVTTFKTIADADEILSMIAMGAKRAVIIGAGPIGLMACNALVTRSVEVTFVEVAKSILPRMLDPEMAGIIQRHLEKKGVRFFLAAQVEQILGRDEDDSIVGGVVVGNRRIDADMIVVATGVGPNIPFMEGIGIEKDRGILVSEKMETSIPGIYAAGDVVEYFDIFGRRNVVPLVVNATRQGETAGLNMTGFDGKCMPSMIFNAVEALGITAFSVGSIEGEESSVLEGNGRIIKLSLEKSKVVGVQTIGKFDGIGTFFDIFNKGFALSELSLDIIATRGFSYADIIQKAILEIPTSN